MSKSIEINHVKLQAAYSTVYQLTHAMGLVLEHDKLEAFHFPEIVQMHLYWLTLDMLHTQVTLPSFLSASGGT